MRSFFLLGSFTLFAACSEAPLEDQGEEAAAQIEKQIEGDAQSLEEAADEAVRVLKSEIEEDLEDDGFANPPPATALTDQNEEQENP